MTLWTDLTGKWVFEKIGICLGGKLDEQYAGIGLSQDLHRETAHHTAIYIMAETGSQDNDSFSIRRFNNHFRRIIPFQPVNAPVFVTIFEPDGCMLHTAGIIFCSLAIEQQDILEEIFNDSVHSYDHSRQSAQYATHPCGTIQRTKLVSTIRIKVREAVNDVILRIFLNYNFPASYGSEKFLNRTE